MNNFIIKNIPTFDGEPELLFDWILKLENMAAVTKWYPIELALGKSQGALFKYLKSLPLDTNLSNVKAILRQQFSLVTTVTHAATWSMHRYQQKGEVYNNSISNSPSLSRLL